MGERPHRSVSELEELKRENRSLKSRVAALKRAVLAADQRTAKVRRKALRHAEWIRDEMREIYEMMQIAETLEGRR